MKISVITASFNNADTIEDTIKSVLSQDFPEIEYIIVDGASKDDTLKIAEKYKSKISKIVSEKDAGIYFALNKGIDFATGEIIAFLHADDMYANEKVLSDVMKVFSEKKADSVYGDLHYVDRVDTSKILRNWKSGEYKDGLFLKGWMPPHPAFFLKKSAYEKFGKFDTSFVSAADYELMLRMLHKNKISTNYLPEVIVKMRAGGTSNVSISNRIRANREDRLAWKINGLNPGMLTLIRKPLSKLKQFL
jgi:glycosyltransferase involved in cell wall biosynthesis